VILIDVFSVRRIQARMGQHHKKAPAVIARALNRAVENARTNVVSKTREDYYVKASEVRSTIRIEKASSSRLMAKVNARDTRRELIGFKVRPGKPNSKKPPAVIRVAVKKNGFKELPGAFLAAGTSSGKVHVLKRARKARYPLLIKYGPSIPEMIGQPKIRIYVENEAKVTFEKRLDHEINRLLGANT